MSSIGRKIFMSLTGMALCVFLLLHMAGNLIILGNPEKYNEYSHMLVSNPLLLPAELGLIFIVVVHVYTAIRLTLRNGGARPVAYQVKSSTGRSRRWFGSSYMMVSGSLILAFLVYHLIHFKFGEYFVTQQNGVEMRDLAKVVKGEFAEIEEVVVYVVAMLLIAIHLAHGFRSLWETLGVATNFWDKFFLWLSRAFVVAVMGGFILIPIVLYIRS